jgi:two-component system, OmpR family, sensor histidine kinase MprB
MRLRHRLVLLAAVTVGATVLLASVACYFAMQSAMRGQIDDALREQAGLIERVTARGIPDPPAGELPSSDRPGAAGGMIQLLDRHGRVRSRSDEDITLTPTAADRQIAANGQGRHLSDREADGAHLRVLTFSGGREGAVQLARSLEDVDATLSRLRYVLAALWLLGTVFAVVIASIFARKVLQPVREIDEAAEHITATHDLTRRISTSRDDEVGRLARRFNTMLDSLQVSRDALAQSAAAQRQLVADASHELRTPVTSLRTNIEVLLEVDELEVAERHRMLADVREQAQELSTLITDVIELARGDQPIEERELVYLDEIVAEAVDRSRRHAPHVRFATALQASVVEGSAGRLARAATNLLDNAAKHTPPGGTVEVSLADGVLEVRDHGDGVPDADKAHVFDRFYRGASSRGRPGSGLGLAIVRQTAEAHGGTVEVADAPGGGAVFRLRTPLVGVREPAPR